jgi:cellobiose-specific phosphotransferase system component IIB
MKINYKSVVITFILTSIIISLFLSSFFKSEKKQEIKEVIDKVRSYDLKFDANYIDRINLSPNGKYGYAVFKKDNKYYVQINNQTYGPYDVVL